jgi:hypothetical protein
VKMRNKLFLIVFYWAFPLVMFILIVTDSSDRDRIPNLQNVKRIFLLLFHCDVSIMTNT